MLICNNNVEYIYEDIINFFKDEKNIYMISNNFNKIVFENGAIAYLNYAKNTQETVFYYKQKIITHTIPNPFPKVSIIMTVYNKSNYVEHSINSVLRQSYKNIELIIVEDCSTDNSLNIINKFQKIHNIKILTNKINLGCYASRNIGISMSSGDIIGFQDADDYTLEHRISRQVDLLLGKNLKMVGCNMIRSHIKNINYTRDTDILLDTEKNILHFDKDCCNEMFGYPTLLIKKELFDKYGKYIERKKGMDMEFPERVMFKELGKKFSTSSWEFFDKESNEIYQKLNELHVISPEMNDLNITNSIKSDDYLINKLWRNDYI